jgi:hypothetical protein
VDTIANSFVAAHFAHSDTTRRSFYSEVGDKIKRARGDKVSLKTVIAAMTEVKLTRKRRRPLFVKQADLEKLSQIKTDHLPTIKTAVLTHILNGVGSEAEVENIMHYLSHETVEAGTVLATTDDSAPKVMLVASGSLNESTKDGSSRAVPVGEVVGVDSWRLCVSTQGKITAAETSTVYTITPTTLSAAIAKYRRDHRNAAKNYTLCEEDSSTEATSSSASGHHDELAELTELLMHSPSLSHGHRQASVVSAKDAEMQKGQEEQEGKEGQELVKERQEVQADRRKSQAMDAAVAAESFLKNVEAQSGWKVEALPKEAWLDALRSHAVEVLRIKAGTTLIRSGRVANGLLIVQKGELQVGLKYNKGGCTRETNDIAPAAG